jgi:lipopolysaccharide/colanic/teichoic acid biosynthesis glycosyltransferase
VRKVSELWGSLKVALALSKVGCVGRLQPPDEFSAAIRLEQARLDRNEHAFSLVVFEAGDLRANAEVTQALVRSLSSRIRSTDEIGWFDDCHIGVLLPYTSRDGAQKFVDDISRAIGTGASPPQYTIYSYPSDWYSDNGHGDSGQLYFTDICGRWGTAERPLARASSQQFKVGTPSTRGSLPIWKRAMDIAGSLFGLTLASPFLLIHVLILKTVSPGPIFFRQERIGYMGRPFKIWKLRTMDVSVDTSLHQEHVSRLINGANKMDSNRPMVKLENDPHIIPGGKILRKMCLDELPQLINVFWGEMSLVGPRPPLLYEVNEFLKWQHRRFDAVPGMTGLWQVSGKNRLTFSKMIRLDIQYSRRKTLLLDLTILLKTPLAIISQIRDGLVLQRKQQLMMEGEHV